MGDRFTEIQDITYGRGIMDSIKGVVIGLILFVVSFPVLWWNEGRVDMSKVAGTSVPVGAETVDASANGQFVSVTGKLASDEAVGDPQFLKPGAYVSLTRTAEMYAWVETKSSTTTKSAGGKKKKKTTYSYERKWTDRPESSSSFKEPAGHENPSPSIDSQTFTVSHAKVGAYDFDPRSARLPKPTRVAIGNADFIPSEGARLEGSYIFSGSGSLQNSQVGDMRLSFSAVQSGITATLFGNLNGTVVEPYFYKGEEKLYRAIAGSREAAIAKMAAEHKILTWILRGGGFLMMLIGLNLFFGPINAVLDIVPFLGNVSRSIIGLAMFLIAAVLSLLTIAVSIIAHNIFLLLGAGVVVLFAIWIIGQMRAKPELAMVAAKSRSAPSASSERAKRRNPDDEEEAMRMAVHSREPPPDRIKFACPECGKKYAVKQSIAGRKVNCKRCDTPLEIPYESTL
jgi:hypothetical protein